MAGDSDWPHLHFQKCIVCDEGTTKSESLKQFKSFTTIQRAAQNRSELQNDIHKGATTRVNRVNSLDSRNGAPVYYHSSSNRRFCAIKRPVAKDAGSNSTVTPPKKKQGQRHAFLLPHLEVLSKTTVFSARSTRSE